MKKHYSLISSVAILVVLGLGIGPQANADDNMQFNQMIQALHNNRAQMEAQLGINPQADTYPQATSYYDDKVAHYEYVLLMSDFIDQGIR